MANLDTLATDSLRKDLYKALEDFIGADKAINLDCFVDKLLAVQGMYCKCQSRKCTSHPYRCWPSRAAWMTTTILLCIMSCIVGIAYNERSAMWGNWQRHWDEQSQQQWAEIEKRLVNIEQESIKKHWWKK